MTQPREGSEANNEGIDQAADTLWSTYDNLENITTQLKAVHVVLCKLQIEVVKLKTQLERKIEKL